MVRKNLPVVSIIFCLTFFIFFPQTVSSVCAQNKKPEIYYSSPRKYKIADIKVTGIDNYEEYVLIGMSGLSVGQIVEVPGDEITDAVKRFWRNGLFSDVKILADKIEGDKIWLEIKLSPRPRISEITYKGVKKSEREDLQDRLGLIVGNQITPNMVDRAVIYIKRYFDGKGYKNAKTVINQIDDKDNPGKVKVTVSIDKKDKIKVHKLIIDGNKALSDRKINKIMKKTNEKGKLVNFFRTKKFIVDNYNNDKDALIKKYNEYGYRDAVIEKDSVYDFDEKTVNVYLKINEGMQYFHRKIDWVGNAVYTTDQLNKMLRIKSGDVYNQTKLDERLNASKNEDAISDAYMNNGYLFFQAYPVEVKVDGDSIDLEIRMLEGKQATINRITITGNDRLYENVIRRELRVKPGALFSKADLMRSAREIAQTGHFDPENMGINPIPNQENGTVDIDFNLTSKSNDQIEFSAGYGSTGIVGSISLKFTNFSLRNLLNFKSYRILPQGDGETFSITGTTNGNYYTSYSFSFTEPWLGGKRPNSLSVSGFYSKQSDVSSRYYNSSNMYGYFNNWDYNNSYMYDIDPDKYLKIWGLSVGLGGRLTWPDDYFQIYGELSYQHYSLKNWDRYFYMNNGHSNDLSASITFGRNSIDNPLYTRSGSSFSLKAKATFPYSLFENYSSEEYREMDKSKLYKWVEYYKFEFKSSTYTPISPDRKLVLKTRFDFGYLGAYTGAKMSPFGQYYVGGDGTTGYSTSYTYQTVGLRGYENGSLGVFPIYDRIGMELHYPLIMQTTTTIYALAFMEGGNVWGSAKEWNPFVLKRSAGFGVRIYLPMVGLMGIDWAYGFDKVQEKSTKVSGGQFHFIIGQEF